MAATAAVIAAAPGAAVTDPFGSRSQRSGVAGCAIAASVATVAGSLTGPRLTADPSLKDSVDASVRARLLRVTAGAAVVRTAGAGATAATAAGGGGWAGGGGGGTGANDSPGSDVAAGGGGAGGASLFPLGGGIHPSGGLGPQVTLTYTVVAQPGCDPVAQDIEIPYETPTPIQFTCHGDDLYYQLESTNQPQHGTLTDFEGDYALYTPDSSFSGQDRFDVEANNFVGPGTTDDDHPRGRQPPDAGSQQ